MRDSGPKPFDSRRQRGSESRVLESGKHSSINEGIEMDTSPKCDVCHWSMLATRRFRGRTVCLACIAEHFLGEDEEQ